MTKLEILKKLKKQSSYEFTNGNRLDSKKVSLRIGERKNEISQRKAKHYLSLIEGKDWKYISSLYKNTDDEGFTGDYLGEKFKLALSKKDFSGILEFD